MLVLTLLCQWRAGVLHPRLQRSSRTWSRSVRTYLRIISWNFVATGLIFTCSGLFQALGNTWPSLLSSGSRLLTFVLPALWLSTRPGFTLTQVWYLSVATVTLQALTSLCAAASGVPPQARARRCGRRRRAGPAGRRLGAGLTGA